MLPKSGINSAPEVQLLAMGVSKALQVSAPQAPCGSPGGFQWSHPPRVPYPSCAWGSLIPGGYRIIDIVTNEVREQSRLSVGSYHYKKPFLGCPRAFCIPLEDHTKKKIHPGGSFGSTWRCELPGQVGEDSSRGEAVPRGAAVAFVSPTLRGKRERPALGWDSGVGIVEGYRGGFHEKLLAFPLCPMELTQLAPRWTQLSPGRREGCGKGVF